MSSKLIVSLATVLKMMTNGLVFKLHFDSVHPGFFVKLKEISAELTENDLRLCAYVRIGIRAKQIAGMLSVKSRQC